MCFANAVSVLLSVRFLIIGPSIYSGFAIDIHRTHTQHICTVDIHSGYTYGVATHMVTYTVDTHMAWDSLYMSIGIPGTYTVDKHMG